MQTRFSFLIVFFSALLLSASPVFSAGGSPTSSEGVSPRCEAAIDKAAGKYSQCLLKASAKFAKNSDEDRLFAMQMRCGDKFNAQVTRAQDRFGKDQCTPYVSLIADRTVTCAEVVSIEAGGQRAVSRMYVQNAAGGLLTETTLVLSGVDQLTLWFKDRPHREAGDIKTAEFVALFFDEGANSFATTPPSADFTCKSDGQVVHQAVTLTNPVLDESEGTLTFTSEIVLTGEEDDSFTEIPCDGEVNLFIDDTTAVSEFEPPDCNMGWMGLINSQDCCRCIWFAGKIRSSLEDKGVAKCAETCEEAAASIGGEWGAAIGAVGCTTLCKWAEGELEDLIAQGKEDQFEEALCFNISAPNPETGKNCFGYMCHELFTDGSGNDSCTTPCRAKCSDWVFNLYSPVTPTGCLTWWTGDGYETTSKQNFCKGQIIEDDAGATDWDSACEEQCLSNACATKCNSLEDVNASVCGCLQESCGVTSPICQ